MSFSATRAAIAFKEDVCVFVAYLLQLNKDIKIASHDTGTLRFCGEESRDHVLFVFPGNVSKISLSVWRALKTFAIISWTNFTPNDPRELLNWVISYREA